MRRTRAREAEREATQERTQEKKRNGQKNLFIQWGRIVKSGENKKQGTQAKQGMDKREITPHWKDNQEITPRRGSQSASSKG
ncbi:hypothetical protein LSAT2_007549, partial [Lamellibrachia satsuma]